MTINEMIHKTLMAGLGVPEKISEVVDDLVTKGELSESQGAKLLREFTEKVSRAGDDINKTISDLINKTLEKMNIPTREEVDRLNKKIMSLSSKVKKLEESGKSG
ncbi:MAG: phasin family protein [Nitrospiraceae bacterium]|nr:MAG: phasin family protein [Nitrospiraceae bacterium]